MFGEQGEQDVARSLRIRRLWQDTLLRTLPMISRSLL
jgi:hypothetical protein